MAKFNVAVKHGMERQQVVEKLVGFSDQMRATVADQVSNIEESWDEDGNLTFSFTAMGFKVAGNVVTCEEHITVSGKLPFAALPFRGAIEKTIEERLRGAIS